MLFRFKIDKKILTTFLLLFLIPPFSFVALNQSSLAVGLVVVSALLFFYLPNRLLINKASVFLIIFLVLIYFFSIYPLVRDDIIKPFVSILFFFFIFLVSLKLSVLFVHTEVDAIVNSILIFIFFLIFLGFMKFFYTPESLGYSAERAVFPFSEKSHFVLVLGFFSLAYSFVGKLKYSILLLCCLSLFGVLYPSLTALVFSVLILLVFIMRSKSFIAGSLVVLFSIIILFAQLKNSEYFTERLSFENTDNLTTLVWLQGLELGYLNFMRSDGVGLGFQMLGNVNTATGDISDRISFLTNGGKLNLQDGGFVSAKLISELGIVGLLIIFMYVLYIFYILYKCRKYMYCQGDCKVERKWLLMNGFIFSYVVEMFLRGYGYFSPVLIVVISAVVSLSSLKVKKKQKDACAINQSQRKLFDSLEVRGTIKSIGSER